MTKKKAEPHSTTIQYVQWFLCMRCIDAYQLSSHLDDWMSNTNWILDTKSQINAVDSEII